MLTTRGAMRLLVIVELFLFVWDFRKKSLRWKATHFLKFYTGMIRGDRGCIDVLYVFSLAETSVNIPRVTNNVNTDVLASSVQYSTFINSTTI